MAEKKQEKQTSKWEMETITIPLDVVNHQSHMFAAVEGVGAYQIERGVPVEVPAPIAEVVKRRQKIEAENAKLIQQLVAKSGIA